MRILQNQEILKRRKVSSNTVEPRQLNSVFKYSFDNIYNHVINED